MRRTIVLISHTKRHMDPSSRVLELPYMHKCLYQSSPFAPTPPPSPRRVWSRLFILHYDFQTENKSANLDGLVNMGLSRFTP